MLFSYASAAFVFASVAFANPTRRASAVFESRPAVPKSFASQGAPSPDTVINLKIGLAAKDWNGLETTLYQVSTPGSDTYGQHLSNDEVRIRSTSDMLLTHLQVKAFVAPTPETVSAVTTWLTENGVQATPSGAYDDWLDISLPVSKANELLNANFETFVHVPSGDTSIRTLSFQLPVDLFEHVDAVHPTTAFARLSRTGPVFTPIVNKNVTSRAVPASCASTVCFFFVLAQSFRSLMPLLGNTNLSPGNVSMCGSVRTFNVLRISMGSRLRLLPSPATSLASVVS